MVTKYSPVSLCALLLSWNFSTPLCYVDIAKARGIARVAHRWSNSGPACDSARPCASWVNFIGYNRNARPKIGIPLKLGARAPRLLKMSELSISLIVLVIMLASGWLGGFIRDRLPKHHLSDESKDSIKIAIAGVTTLAALVLGLLVASAKSSYDTKFAEVQQGAAKILLLDSTLRELGTPGDKPREFMRRFLTVKLNYSFIGSQPTPSDPGAPAEFGINQLQRAVGGIVPTNDAQRPLQNRAAQLTYELAQTRWLLYEQSGRTISTPLLAVLVFWLAIITATLSLFAPRNGTVRAVGVLCVLAVSSTIFILLEMDEPFRGLIRIPDTPLRNAIAVLNR